VLAALAALCGLAGCGPGVGGTGTGDSVTPGHAGSPFTGFAARSVCDSPLAMALVCSSGTGGVVQPTVNGLFLANGTPSATVQARLDGAGWLQVQWRCLDWQFNGQWGETAALGPRWYGWVAQAGRVQPATLAMAATEPPRLQLTLTDDNGTRLTGPDPLQVVPGSTTAGSCP